MGRMTGQEIGERIFDTLAEHLGGLNRKMLAHHADLKPSQVATGLDWLRDTFEPIHPFVIVRRGGEWIYVLAMQEQDVREYLERRWRGQITRARRDYNELHGFAVEHPSAENSRQEDLARRRVVDLTYAYHSMFGQQGLDT